MVEQNLRILMRQDRTKGWVCLLPWAVLTMNSQKSPQTNHTAHELFHGGRAVRLFKSPFPESHKSPVGE